MTQLPTNGINTGVFSQGKTRKKKKSYQNLKKPYIYYFRHHLFLYPDQFEVNEVDILNIRNTHKQDKAADIMVSDLFFNLEYNLLMSSSIEI